MGFGNGFILLITWVVFVTVSPYPTDLTEISFDDADFSIPDFSSDDSDWLMPSAEPLPGEADDGLTVAPFSAMDSIGNEMIEGDQWSFYDENNIDIPDDLNEPVNAALALNDDSIAMSPAPCTSYLSRRRVRRDMTLGIFTCLSGVLFAGAEFGKADSETEICRPTDPQKPADNLLPILPPIVPPWECSDGRKPYCCSGLIDEETGWVRGCTPCTVYFLCFVAFLPMVPSSTPVSFRTRRDMNG